MKFVTLVVIYKLACSYHSKRQTFSFMSGVQPTIEIGL